MQLKFKQTMAEAVEQLVIDPQSRFLEMKSLQPYSTKDEYLYAMKEDLADWLSNMYPDWAPITADSFLETLENGVLLCHHANNVNEAARKSSSATSQLTNCKYRSDARPQTFNARDNVSQFIKWSRRVAGVREVLMFESDDLILRKNEKNFILCLLEIARFGAKFGFSVPAIIRLEQEIEREIERDKQTEKLGTSQFEQMVPQHDENQFDSNENDDQQINQYDLTDNNQEIIDTNSNGANYLEEQDLMQYSNNDNSKLRQNSEESFDSSTTSSDVPPPIVISDEESIFNKLSQQKPKQKPIVPPPSSSHLHKTVVNIVNSCCCSSRFPVIRIGEGKYRIGENGTIIFIRILRNHVMVRVGGGWDTLENYLNKHDPCRRSGAHRRNEHSHHHHHHHSDIPILAVPNANISPSVQKNTPYGKSVTIKTEEFPLAKPSTHDTNLVDAQLVITRGADGRHRIGQITYKSEEDTLNPPTVCPHHHHPSSASSSSPPTITKSRTIRNPGPSTFIKQSSPPSTDQDYSSLTETPTYSKPSSYSSLDLKDESLEESLTSLNLTITDNHPIQHITPHPEPINQQSTSVPQKFEDRTYGITESIIGNIDGHIYPTSTNVEQDFDIRDIEDVMGIKKKKSQANQPSNNIDNDSLENVEGVIEEKPKDLPPPSKKSHVYTSTYSSTQKQIANRKRPPTNLNRYSATRSSTSNVIEALKKEEQAKRQQSPQRKANSAAQRSQSSEILDKLTDISKLDRDSGFDEQDFRRERLLSNGDDNSSTSSVKSPRGSITGRTSHLEIRENKAYELRMKKLDAKKNTPEKETSVKPRKYVTSTTRRTTELMPPVPSASTARKNSQPIINTTKQQTHK